jgi:hypothetical protein
MLVADRQFCLPSLVSLAETCIVRDIANCNLETIEGTGMTVCH